MYISRVQIDTDSMIKMRGLTTLNDYHKWVESCFDWGNEEEGKRERRLWRVDKVGGKTYLLVVSEQEPSIEGLESIGGVVGTAVVKGYREYLDRLYEGGKYKFRVVLNPTRRIFDGKKSKIVGHVTQEYQMRYLLDRLEGIGVKVNEGAIGIVERGVVRSGKGNGGRGIGMVKVTYEGVLEVVDLELFKKCLIEGFGRGKAFGFGLMTVIPLGN